MIPTVWNKKSYQEYLKYLESLSEEKYKNFQGKLTFTKYEMLGIRIPMLRRIAKMINKTDVKEFLKLNQNKYYEEVMIAGFVVASIQDETEFDEAFFNHIKKIDDWSLCDSFCNSLKRLRENCTKYFEVAKELCFCKEEFISRVGLILILVCFIEKENLADIFIILNKIYSEQYYINMAEAWLVCELYIKYREETRKFLTNNNMNDFTQNKAISKIRDSYRVTKEEKDYLNTLKRK